MHKDKPMLRKNKRLLPFFCLYYPFLPLIFDKFTTCCITTRYLRACKTRQTALQNMAFQPPICRVLQRKRPPFANLKIWHAFLHGMQPRQIRT